MNFHGKPLHLSQKEKTLQLLFIQEFIIKCVFAVRSCGRIGHILKICSLKAFFNLSGQMNKKLSHRYESIYAALLV